MIEPLVEVSLVPVCSPRLKDSMARRSLRKRSPVCRSFTTTP